MSEVEIPQWKKDLIARLRSQNRRTQQLSPPPPPKASPAQELVQYSQTQQCECATTMVQQEAWDASGRKSDSDEDLHYGPGIVSKLKERYLSLAQREKPRPTTTLRKAASLENILDEEPKRRFQGRENKSTNKYQKKACELKRARSVETISEHQIDVKPKRESLHEDMLINNRNELIIPEKNVEKTYVPVNRPKKIAPVVSEREKPPAEIVKQTTLKFEKRTRVVTQKTGEVATKVANFKTIIDQSKTAKKPPIKTKPLLNGFKSKDIIETAPKLNEVNGGDKRLEKRDEMKLSDEFWMKNSGSSLPSPIPDISRVDIKLEENGTKVSSLTETPDLILTSSPLPIVESPSFRISATENFIKEEIRISQTNQDSKKIPIASPPVTNDNIIKESLKSETQAFLINKNTINTPTPISQPLKVEINGVDKKLNNERKSSSPSSPPNKQTPFNLTSRELQKNLINTTKNSKCSDNNKSVSVVDDHCKSDVEVSQKNQVPKQVQSGNNSLVFNFVNRKDVPDYVKNDGVNRPSKLEKPKVGEGGYILIPGASTGESFTDEDDDDDLWKSLEGPPSPCDVAFINDNILIDGKSSLKQKKKPAKLRLSFVHDDPEIYEYPSESSLLIDDIPSPVQKLNSVPALSGSSLANYTPKSTEEFQPGITRSSINNMTTLKQDIPKSDLSGIEQPIAFSAGANSDILF